MKIGMNAQSGEPLEGIAYLKQRLRDVIITPLGSIVGARDFGSLLYQMLDKNLDSSFYMDAYVKLADAISNPANGLDDFKLSNMSIETVADQQIEITVSGSYLATGEALQLDGIELNGRN